MQKKPKVVQKPWGKFEEFATNKKVTVKIITVKKGGILSLQSHNHRSEMWVALDDGLSAQVHGKKIKMKPGQIVRIPKKAKHRISSVKTARFLEISSGKFDENDIIRYSDIYGRVSK